MENKNNLQTSFDITEVTRRLIGHTGVAGESNYDKESYDNLELVHDLLIDWTFDLIKKVDRYIKSPHYSEKLIAKRALSILEELYGNIEYIKEEYGR